MNIPTCRDMSELVTDHLEHDLPVKERFRVLLHLALCPACRRYFAQMRATVRLLRTGQRPAAPPAAEAEILARMPDGDGG